jgi:alginate export protein
MDLRLGYLELGDVERKPVSFRAGRQELAFGDERLIGSADWLNTARSFDALRGVFRWDGFRVDAFAASVVKIHDGQFNDMSQVLFSMAYTPLRPAWSRKPRSNPTFSGVVLPTSRSKRVATG